MNNLPLLPAMVQTSIKSVAQPLPHSIALEDFLKLPETKPASEFIDGHIIPKPMPQGKHSTIQGDLGASINLTLKSPRIARAYTELRCTFGDRSRSVSEGYSIVPDVAVFGWERIPRDEDGKVANVFALAPDWTIEILSPAQSQTKVVRNILHCLSNGTQMGWLIDPEEELVFVYLADRTISIYEQKNDLLPVPGFAASWQLTIGELFSWLED